MQYALRVAIVQATDELFEYTFRYILLQLAPLAHIVE